MWRRRTHPLLRALTSRLMGLCFTASVLFGLVSSAHAQDQLITFVRTNNDSVISQMLIKDTIIDDNRLNLFENGTNPFNFVAVEYVVQKAAPIFLGNKKRRWIR